MATTIILTNSFHGTATRVRLRAGGGLSRRQVARARRVLCATPGCRCAQDAAATNGSEWIVFPVDSEGLKFDVFRNSKCL